ncbi:MAG: U32 family peptidase C-terminal domain-containing protein, partial [Desulfobacterales bacterium]
VMEETRPGQFFPLEEDGRGSYVFSSRDLCMLDHLPALMGSGVKALKIEGRMKGIYYLATVVGIYRQALDAYGADPDRYRPAPAWREEIARVSRRELCTGFYFGDPSQTESQFDDPREDHPQGRFLAKVLAQGHQGQVTVEVRNRLARGDAVAVISPGRTIRSDEINAIYDLEGNELAVAHPGQTVRIGMQGSYAAWDLIRGQPRPDPRGWPQRLCAE